MSTDHLRCSERELTLLRPLDELAASSRLAVTRWLWEHDITPSAVAIGFGIERDDIAHVLVWRERQDDGTIIKRWRFAARDDRARWPAPFPPALAETLVRRRPRLERTAGARS